jgi:hypothetical protein
MAVFKRRDSAGIGSQCVLQLRELTDPTEINPGYHACQDSVHGVIMRLGLGTERQRDREAETKRHRETKREREKERQKERQRETRKKERQKERVNEREEEIERERKRERETERQKGSVAPRYAGMLRCADAPIPSKITQAAAMMILAGCFPVTCSHDSIQTAEGKQRVLD